MVNQLFILIFNLLSKFSYIFQGYDSLVLIQFFDFGSIPVLTCYIVPTALIYNSYFCYILNLV